MTTNKQDGGQAFPVSHVVHPKDGAPHLVIEGGLSIRDWFAGQALPTVIGLNVQGGDKRVAFNATFAAACAYGIADAMIAHRSIVTKDGVVVEEATT